MALSRTVVQTGQPVDLEQVKDWLRLQSTTDDTWLSRDIIPAAVSDAEALTSRAFLDQTFVLRLRGFGSGPIVLPYPPLDSVTSITYTSTSGTAGTSWASSKYTVETPSGEFGMHATIQPNFDQVYPATQDVVDSVVITFVAGYGKIADVPAGIKRGIAKLCQASYLDDPVLVVEARDLLMPYNAWLPDLRLD